MVTKFLTKDNGENLRCELQLSLLHACILDILFFAQVILAARSEYFRALLYGGMKESTQVSLFYNHKKQHQIFNDLQSEIELPDAPVKAFKILLKYIYTGNGNISFSNQSFNVFHFFFRSHAFDDAP